eukprot:5901819-Amphidinium_carterae.1
MRYVLASARAVWPYTREQWHKLNSFFAALRVSADPVPRMTLMELYLLYLVLNADRRFATEISEDHKGGWISTQLERFRTAIICWQTVTSCERIIPEDLRFTVRAKWGVVWGFPNLLQLDINGLCHPRWQEARNLLQSAPQELARLDLQEHSHAAELWRRWSPGLVSSQLFCCSNGLDSRALYLQPLLRLSGKSNVPQWQRQQYEARQLRCKMLLLPDAHVSHNGVTVMGLLDSFGISQRSDIRSISASFGAQQRRIGTLMRHNADALTHCRHIVSDFSNARPVCVNCGAFGSTSFKISWLRQYCSNQIERDLQEAFDRSVKVSAAVAAIFRKV